MADREVVVVVTGRRARGKRGLIESPAAWIPNPSQVPACVVVNVNQSTSVALESAPHCAVASWFAVAGVSLGSVSCVPLQGRPESPGAPDPPPTQVPDEPASPPAVEPPPQARRPSPKQDSAARGVTTRTRGANLLRPVMPPEYHRMRRAHAFTRPYVSIP
jgi:hypothetical protein